MKRVFICVNDPTIGNTGEFGALQLTVATSALVLHDDNTITRGGPTVVIPFNPLTANRVDAFEAIRAGAYAGLEVEFELGSLADYEPIFSGDNLFIAQPTE